MTDSSLVLSKYRLLAETMHDVAIFVGGDGRIIEVNAAAVKTYCRTAEELVGSPAAEFCYRGDRCAIQRTLETGEARTCECVHRRADGTLLPLEVSTVRADIGGEHLILSTARGSIGGFRLSSKRRCSACPKPTSLSCRSRTGSAIQAKPLTPRYLRRVIRLGKGLLRASVGDDRRSDPAF